MRIKLALLFGPFLFGTLANCSAQPGNVLWTYDTAASIRSSPAVDVDGTIYICAADTLYAITNYGSNKWTVSIGGGDCGSPALGSDHSIYVENGGLGSLFVRNQDGSAKWAFATGGGNACPGLAFDYSSYVFGFVYLYGV